MNQEVLLFQIDGKLPNLALMRIARHHRDRGEISESELREAIEAIDRASSAQD